MSKSWQIQHPSQEVNIKRIRVRKEDSAYVYFLLEAYEGAAAYSTLPFEVGDAWRDLELIVPVAFLSEINDLLNQLGDMIYELK